MYIPHSSRRERGEEKREKGAGEGGDVLIKFPVNESCAMKLIHALGLARSSGLVDELEVDLLHTVREVGVVIDVDHGAQFFPGI